MEVTTESICIDYLADFSDKKNNDLKASYYENYIFSVTGVMARGLVSPTAVILGESISKKASFNCLKMIFSNRCCTLKATQKIFKQPIQIP